MGFLHGLRPGRCRSLVLPTGRDRWATVRESGGAEYITNGREVEGRQQKGGQLRRE